MGSLRISGWSWDHKSGFGTVWTSVQLYHPCKQLSLSTDMICIHKAQLRGKNQCEQVVSCTICRCTARLSGDQAGSHDILGHLNDVHKMSM
jgi:hypothetical protein